MTIRLTQTYMGELPPGHVATFPPSVEADLIASRYAVDAPGAVVTAGNQFVPYLSGRVGIAAGQSTVTIRNPQITAASTVNAAISQAAADATLTSIVRTTCAAGSATITGNANATAVVTVAFQIDP